jgi:membrane protease YdiL (CAAX protease family)
MFAAIHGNLMTFVPLLVFALVLVALYERTDTLMAPFCLHASFNAVNFILLVTGWDPWAAPSAPGWTLP